MSEEELNKTQEILDADEYDVIFITNLPSDATEQELNELLNEYDPVKINLFRNFKDRTCKGFGYGIFNNNDLLADHIIEDKEFYLQRGDEKIKISMTQSDEYDADEDENECAVFIQGINPNISSGRAREDLEEEIFRYCNFTNLIVPKTKNDKNKNRGQAFVYTLDQSESSKLIQLLNGSELFTGYFISCKYAKVRDNVKPSYR